jgi:hypothetical protein
MFLPDSVSGYDGNRIRIYSARSDVHATACQNPGMKCRNGRQEGENIHADGKTYSENMSCASTSKAVWTYDKTLRMHRFPDQSISDILNSGLLQSPVTIRE